LGTRTGFLDPTFDTRQTKNWNVLHVSDKMGARTEHPLLSGEARGIRLFCPQARQIRIQRQR
jgi:hypothetical protein